MRADADDRTGPRRGGGAILPLRRRGGSDLADVLWARASMASRAAKLGSQSSFLGTLHEQPQTLNVRLRPPAGLSPNHSRFHPNRRAARPERKANRGRKA